MTTTGINGAPPGITLVALEVLADISQHQMLQALPPELAGLPRETVHLMAVKASLADLGSFDWFAARQRQLEEVADTLKPLLDKHPDWPVQQAAREYDHRVDQFEAFVL
jgi:hypothetical protein